MSQSLSPTDIAFQEFLQLLPEDAIEQAYDFQAFTRKRKIQTPQQLMRLVFLYCALDQSLRESAATFTHLYERLTDTAVKKRLLACLPWVRALLTQLLSTQQVQMLEFGGRLLVVDGSVLTGPGANGVDWRAHLVLDLFRLEFVFIEITDDKDAESLEKVPVQPGDLVVADRGYCRQLPLLSVVERGGDVLVRMMLQTILLQPHTGQKLSLMEELQAREHQEYVSFELDFSGNQSKQTVRGWLHAQQLPEEVASKKRRELRTHRRKKGKGQPKAETLYLAGWVVVFSTLAPDQLGAKEALDLYRMRWQIELVIKRLKQLLKASNLRCKKGSELGELWILGKFLYALCLEKKLRRAAGRAWQDLREEREETSWRGYKLMNEKLRPIISGSAYWAEERFDQAMEVLKERPRRRKLARLSDLSLRKQPPNTMPANTNTAD